MKLSEFIAEIETDFSSYTNSGDIDRLSIKRWVINELKRFGTNILTLEETVLDIKNSQAKLPENFRSLKLALKTEPLGWDLQSGNENDFVSFKRIETPAYFNQTTREYVTTCHTKIIEEVVTLGNSSAKYYYGNTQWLSLTNTIKNKGYATNCLNLNPSIRNSFPHEININNQTLHTNFTTGSVYIQYYGYETDEDGEIIISDGWLGHLEKYLEYYCKARIAENLIANNKNPQSLQGLYQVYRQEADKYFSNAQTEWKFKALGENWHKKMKAQSKRDFNRYILPTL
jgi:hypothetical protein